jgi:hypothetical protein
LVAPVTDTLRSGSSGAYGAKVPSSGAAPHAVPSCAAGGCALGSCSPGYANCNGLVSDGCEVHSDVDSSNCGACGTICTGGTICVAGACALVNPVGHGVPGITRSRILHWLGEIHRTKPAGNWIILGETLRARVLPDFVKASGAAVLGGMRCNPDQQLLSVVDPENKYRALTDRYAWIHFHKAGGPVPILEAAEGLAYDIKIPLSADLLDRLDVKHILEIDLPRETPLPEHFHVVDTREGCRLLERD